MITVQILEGQDVVEPEDWCRPLEIVSMSGGHSDYYSFRSQYSGAPENNVKWVKVKYILGHGWHYSTVEQIRKGLGQYHTYEFIRGDIPKKHQLNLKDYNVTDHTKEFYHPDHDEVDDDIPF